MLASQFLNKIQENTPLPPIVLFCPGKAAFNKEDWEPQLAEQAVQQFIDIHLDPTMHDMALSIFHADECTPQQIAEEAQTLPFLSPNRIIVVRNAAKFSAMAGDKKSPLFSLLSYLDDPADFTTILFIAHQADKRKKFYKTCAAKGLLVECPQLEDAELINWVQKKLSTHQKTIQHSAAHELIHRAGSRLSDINNSLELVINYIGETEKISLEDVIAATADVAEESVWTLTDAIATSNSRQALDALHQLLGFGKSPDEIMGLVNWLMMTAYAALPETTPQVKSQYQLKKVAPMAKRLGIARVKRAFELCTKTHLMIRSTGVDQSLALELLVVKLTFPQNPARR